MFDLTNNPQSAKKNNTAARVSPQRQKIVIESTKQFKEMINTIGFRPSNKHSLDRIDVNGNYEISNIRWATDTEQARNTRRSQSTAGVVWAEDRKKWRAWIGVNKKLIHLGSFKNKHDAVSARIAGMVKYW